MFDSVLLIPAAEIIAELSEPSVTELARVMPIKPPRSAPDDILPSVSELEIVMGNETKAYAVYNRRPAASVLFDEVRQVVFPICDALTPGSIEATADTRADSSTLPKLVQSIPVMVSVTDMLYVRCAGDGDSDGAIVGVAVGVFVGAGCGDRVVEGATEGIVDADGANVGPAEGTGNGTGVGKTDGRIEFVGNDVGKYDGKGYGARVGTCVGAGVGESVGLGVVGVEEGVLVGSYVG